MTIRLSHVFPPIPFRGCDWCAYFDELDEDGPRGWGATPLAAVSDLLVQEPLS